MNVEDCRVRSIVFNTAVAGLLRVVTCPPIGLGGSVQVSVYQKFILRTEAGFTDETIAALYVLPFKVRKNLKLSLLQFKIVKPLQPVHSQKSFQGQDY